jgi:hypothetical protein
MARYEEHPPTTLYYGSMVYFVIAVASMIIGPSYFKYVKTGGSPAERHENAVYVPSRRIFLSVPPASLSQRAAFTGTSSSPRAYCRENIHLTRIHASCAALECKLTDSLVSRRARLRCVFFKLQIPLKVPSTLLPFTDPHPAHSHPTFLAFPLRLQNIKPNSKHAVCVASCLLRLSSCCGSRGPARGFTSGIL